MDKKKIIYDQLSKLLFNYENQDNPDDPNINWEGEFYEILVTIQVNWEKF
jgi:hypothetical protein